MYKKINRVAWVYVLLFSLNASAAACCCYPGISCVAVNASVTASIAKAVTKLKQNDKETYAKKIDELSQYIERINAIEQEVAKKENKLNALEKTETFYNLKKNELLKKITKLEEISFIANNSIAKAQITEFELEILRGNSQ